MKESKSGALGAHGQSSAFGALGVQSLTHPETKWRPEAPDGGGGGGGVVPRMGRVPRGSGEESIWGHDHYLLWAPTISIYQ